MFCRTSVTLAGHKHMHSWRLQAAVQRKRKACTVRLFNHASLDKRPCIDQRDKGKGREWGLSSVAAVHLLPVCVAVDRALQRSCQPRSCRQWWGSALTRRTDGSA